MLLKHGLTSAIIETKSSTKLKLKCQAIASSAQLLKKI